MEERVYQSTRPAYATARATLRTTPLVNRRAMDRTTLFAAQEDCVETERSKPSMAPSRRWEPSERQAPHKSDHTLRNILIVAALCAYGIGALVFATHFTPGTTVDGVDASMMTVDELTEALEERSDAYEQHITNADGFDTTIKGSDIALTSDVEHTALEAQNRSVSALWPINIVAPPHLLIDAGVTVDEDALKGAIKSAVDAYNKKAEAPKNAHGTFDEKEGRFVVAAEEHGTAIDADKLCELSLAATRELREEVAVTDAVLKLPAITSDNEKLAAAVAKANDYLDGSSIDLVCDNQVVTTIDNKTIASWIKFDDDLNVAFDGIYKWLENNETVQEVGYEENDQFVYDFDIQETTDDIHRVLEKDKGDKAQLKRTIVEVKPGVDPNAKELGRHIDINLTDQYVRFYDEKGKVIWESYCVTGGYDAVTGAMHHTPTGTFAIEAKDTDVVLRGADLDHDNKPDYESHVNYWMPFLNNDYGLHDADWRSDFGGDIRTYYGSHGCVNLPPDAAEELFHLIKVGDMVIVREQEQSEDSEEKSSESESENEVIEGTGDTAVPADETEEAQTAQE